MAEKARAHIFVSGRVQGVFFRAGTQEKAQQLGLTGWVRNLPDGRVEIVCEGEKEKVDELIKWAKKGPELARIDNLEVNWEEFGDEFENFEIKYV